MRAEPPYRNRRRQVPTAVALGLVVVALVGATAGCRARPPAGRLERLAYTSSDGSQRQAYVYLPVGYASRTERRWPLMLFLHGDGERGDGGRDLDWVLAHGPLYEAWIQRRDLPFVILAPQLPLFGREKTVSYIRDRDPATIPRRLEKGVPERPVELPTPRPMTGVPAASELPYGARGLPDGWPEREGDLLALLDLALERFRVDSRRVYLTGLSYGGFSTWYLASRHPERFAAIAPIVGWGHPDLMAPLARRRMPIWVFAGGRDDAVPVQYFYAGLNELERLGHREVRFTVEEDMGHDVWRRVYAGNDLYDWMLSQRLDD